MHIAILPPVYVNGYGVQVVFHQYLDWWRYSKIVISYLTIQILCNTFTPQIKGAAQATFCMYPSYPGYIQNVARVHLYRH